MPDKSKGGRPAHKPTDAQRKMVESMSAYGVPQMDISKVIGIERSTLQKHYREELDTATAKANSRVAQSLYNKALGDGSSAVTAAIFWLKTRGGWRETSNVNHISEDGTMSPSGKLSEFLNDRKPGGETEGTTES